MLNRAVFLASLFLGSSALFAQQNSYEMGPALNDEDLANLSPETSKEDVIKKYGPPSFRCFTPNNHNICYFHQKKEKKGITEQRQVEIIFGEDGKIKEVRVYEPIGQDGQDDGQKSQVENSVPEAHPQSGSEQ